MTAAAPDPRRPPPTHVAVIMDGNGRWAHARGLPRAFGHRRGVEAVREIVRSAADLGVGYLTLYSFSSENWSRPVSEIQALMGLLRIYLRGEVAELHREGVRLRFIGDRSRLPPDIVELIEHTERLTVNNPGLQLIIALSYGSRAEIVAAVRQLAANAVSGAIRPEAITEADVAGCLFTRGIPDPDLVIRTSGEKRLSNFLMWQAAYAEFIFVDTLWPDFSRRDFEDAIHEYHRRDRRYGAVGS